MNSIRSDQRDDRWWQASDGKWYPPDRSPGAGWWRDSDGNWHPPLLPRRRPSRRVRRATTTSAIATGTGMLGFMFGGNTLMLCEDCSTAELAAAVVLFSYGYLASWFGIILLQRVGDEIDDSSEARGLWAIQLIVIAVISLLWLGSATTGGDRVLSLALGASLVLGIALGSIWPLPPRDTEQQTRQSTNTDQT